MRTFIWDYRNRLTGVTDTVNGVTQQTTYTYDALNQRIAKTDGNQTTRFVYDRGNVYLEFSGNSSTPGTRYLYGPMVDQVLAQESASVAPENKTTWMLTDHLGSVRDLVNNSGTAVNHFTYDSFGGVSSSTGTVDTRYKYTGREYDVETGLHYYRARYYDTGVGRFIGQDPIGFQAGDSNLYRYVDNSPLNATDPSGNFKVELHYRWVELGRPFGIPLSQVFKPYHIDIVAVDKDGSRGYWARPANQERANKGLPTPIVFVRKAVGYQRSDIIETVYDDGTNCPNPKLEAKIRAAFEKIHNARINYAGLGVNSNSAAFYVLRSVKELRIPNPPKVNASGWALDPFTNNHWDPDFDPRNDKIPTILPFPKRVPNPLKNPPL
ncbi:RHS repeat-associated core domain-containing protein (plasmid) [Kovacikia minuta CCNUW1]|uniref:RHS repeat-associated core domain-containing protein n=1 Tax=Kovacikia minuta TaxID=2931930 RepID=UPI001CC9D578|nr:RHS repeat-associated core domain-containing protein [Kovacikia minuta]UBF30102.1 RHS repeat-associated core domain-containing protein [Kovacikia minuta CCNUW1]